MGRIKYLDGIKGICCYLVFLQHFCNVGFAIQLKAIKFFSDCFSGMMCVSLFILISSFCICISIEKKLARFGNIQNIILKRYFRIVIPAAFVILFSYICFHLGLCYNIRVGQITGNSILLKIMNDSSLITLVKNIFYSPVGKCTTWLPQGWMLLFVFLGSFLTIILYLGTERLKELKLYLVCFFFFLLSFFIDCYYACIVFGFFLFKYSRGRKLNNMSVTITSLLCYIILFYCFHNEIINYDQEIVKSILALFFMTAVIHSDYLKKFFESKIFLWLGKISFSLYLLHWLLIDTISCYIFLNFQSIDKCLLSIINLVVTTGLLLFLSWLSQKYIEQGIANFLERKIVNYLEN